MKKTFLLLLVFATTTIFAQTTKTLSKTTYSIKYPDTWTLGTTTNTSFDIFAGNQIADKKYRGNLNLDVRTIDASYTVQSYAVNAKKTLPTKIAGFKVTEEKAITQGGKKGYYMVFKGQQKPDKDALKWKQFYFIEKGKIFILTFTCEEANFEAYIKSIGTSVLSTFTVK
jgi:PsbP-like protein